MRLRATPRRLAHFYVLLPSEPGDFLHLAKTHWRHAKPQAASFTAESSYCFHVAAPESDRNNSPLLFKIKPSHPRRLSAGSLRRRFGCFGSFASKKKKKISIGTRKTESAWWSSYYVVLRLFAATIGRANSTKSSMRTGHAPEERTRSKVRDDRNKNCTAPSAHLHRLTFLVVIRHVVCNHVAEVQQEVPRVFGNRALVMLLNAARFTVKKLECWLFPTKRSLKDRTFNTDQEEAVPQVQELEPTRENQIPVSHGHLQVWKLKKKNKIFTFSGEL